MSMTQTAIRSIRTPYHPLELRHASHPSSKVVLKRSKAIYPGSTMTRLNSSTVPLASSTYPRGPTMVRLQTGSCQA